MRAYIEKKSAILVNKSKKIKLSPLFKVAIKELFFNLGSLPFLWQLLFFYIPLTLLLISSVVMLSPTGHFSSFTLQHFSHLLDYSYFRILLNTVGLALATACICLVFAFPLSYFLAFKSGRWKNLLLFLLIIPFWTNFILHIYAWYFVLEGHGFVNRFLLTLGIIDCPLLILNSTFAILLMMVYYYLPFMVLPIFASLERFDSRLLEASLDLGASRTKTLCRILIPLSKNALFSGFFLVFIPAFGEFVIPELMGGDKNSFMGNVVSSFILGENTLSIGIAYTVLATFFLLIASYIIKKILEKSIKYIGGLS